MGVNGKGEEVDCGEGELGKNELIDFNDYEGEIRFKSEEGDIMEMFLTFSN